MNLNFLETGNGSVMCSTTISAKHIAIICCQQNEERIQLKCNRVSIQQAAQGVMVFLRGRTGQQWRGWPVSGVAAQPYPATPCGPRRRLGLRRRGNSGVRPQKQWAAPTATGHRVLGGPPTSSLSRGSCQRQHRHDDRVLLGCVRIAICTRFHAFVLGAPAQGDNLCFQERPRSPSCADSRHSFCVLAVNTTPQMTCFRGAKRVHKMATGKSDDELLQHDKLRIWTRSENFRKVKLSMSG